MRNGRQDVFRMVSNSRITVEAERESSTSFSCPSNKNINLTNRTNLQHGFNKHRKDKDTWPEVASEAVLEKAQLPPLRRSLFCPSPLLRWEAFGVCPSRPLDMSETSFSIFGGGLKYLGRWKACFGHTTRNKITWCLLHVFRISSCAKWYSNNFTQFCGSRNGRRRRKKKKKRDGGRDSIQIAESLSWIYKVQTCIAFMECCRTRGFYFAQPVHNDLSWNTVSESCHFMHSRFSA